MYKIDLHTHSVASPDGGISENEYTEIIAKKQLDYIAIIDHNRIDFALSLHQKLGATIIVGEEIMTHVGEVVGLFLSKKIEPFQSLKRTIAAIQKQKGLVYIPHPFDSFRKGIGKKNLITIASTVDIIEGFNGRMLLHGQNKQAQKFAEQHHIPIAVGSDAHSVLGIGNAYVLTSGKITRDNIKSQLSGAQFVMQYQPWYAYFTPNINRFRKIKRRE